MKYASKHGPVHRDHDGPEMTEAIDWFRARGQTVHRVSDHQLKWRTLSYYPVKGTVRPDDGKSLEAKGLKAMEHAMCEILGEQSLPLVVDMSMPDERR